MTNITEETMMQVILMNKSKISESVLDFPEASQKLTSGLLSIYEKPFEHVKNDLLDLMSKQVACITQMEVENKKLFDFQEDTELKNLFLTMECYEKKLSNIKQQILLIHKKIFKLKKKALQFKQIK